MYISVNEQNTTKLERILISELGNHIGDTVRVRGRVHTVRNQGKIIFIILRDRSGKEQAVVWSGNGEDLFNKAKTLTSESVIDITGIVKEAKQVKSGPQQTLFTK